MTTGIWNRAGEFPQRFRRVSAYDSAAGANERALASLQQIEEIRAVLLRQSGLGQRFHAVFITAEMKRAFALERALPVLDIFGNVDDHGTGAAAPGDFERRAHGAFEIFRLFHEKHMLGAGAHEIKDRRFLESVRADGVAGNLAADQHDRNGIGHAVTNGRYAVSGRRT